MAEVPVVEYVLLAGKSALSPGPSAWVPGRLAGPPRMTAGEAPGLPEDGGATAPTLGREPGQGGVDSCVYFSNGASDFISLL